MPTTSLKLRLLPRAESAVRRGHPWIFAESIKSRNREGSAGELAVIYDRRDRFLALGLYDPSSPIRVRILHTGGPATIDRSWWLDRAIRAAARREPVFSPSTTGARCLHGESDGFPGLVADRYADTLVVKLYSAVWLPHWTTIEGVLRQVFAPRFLVLRLSRNLRETAASHGLHEGFHGAQGPETVVFQENGLYFEAAVRHGQKTGFFLDQRDNRARVEPLAAGHSVLNLFSFSGGFSVYAARGGATRVLDIDISHHALESARRNFALNPQLAKVPHLGEKADAFRWIAGPGENFGLVICDPPSLAKRERDREGALAAYHRLNAAALARVAPGGHLVTASCSAHVPADGFFAAVRGAAARSGRPFRECWTSGHAADHPASFPEAHYLKAICLQLE